MTMRSPSRRAEIRARAARLLLAQKPKSFFALGLLDLRRFRTEGRYLLDTFEAYFESTGTPRPASLPDGMTLLRQGGLPLILYRADLHQHRRNWTIAHELGHLLLGHSAGTPAEEREADCFAAELLMPSAVVAAFEETYRKAMSAEEMTRSFAVSPLAAARRRRDLDRQGFGVLSPDERRLIEMLF